MKATRILYSKNLNQVKYDELKAQSKLLGQLRSEVWQKYGSINGVGIKDRYIRDQWLKEGRSFAPLSANTWKETLRDTISNISLSREAAKVKARKDIFTHTKDQVEQKRLFTLLKNNKWIEDKYLTRIMRKYWKRGHNHVDNQIVVRSDSYSVFKIKDNSWISIPSLVKGKRVAIPLSSSAKPSGTLRVILNNNKVEVHYAIDVERQDNCGSNIVGIDKGYTEVFVDSEGISYGEGLGKIISKESDRSKPKGQARNKLFQVAEKSNQPKKERIKKNNLGRKKFNAHKVKARSKIKTVIFTATHQLVDKAKIVVAEDLTMPMSRRSFGKNMNRKLSSWTKGVMAEALENVSQRRSSSLHLVNPAYTSQVDHRTGCFTGIRKGDQFHCEHGVVYQSDENAARNVLARLYDSEIGRWTSYKKVKSILLKRTESYRLGLLNLDSSCTKKLVSTESELLFN